MRIRMLLLAVLTTALGFGVLVMHSTVTSPMTHGTPEHAVMQAHDSSGVQSHGALSPAMPHAMSHPCVFILAGAAALILGMLVWIGARPSDDRRRAAFRSGHHGVGRAPPWTTPNLSQLSVLRL